MSEIGVVVSKTAYATGLTDAMMDKVRYELDNFASGSENVCIYEGYTAEYIVEGDDVRT